MAANAAAPPIPIHVFAYSRYLIVKRILHCACSERPFLETAAEKSLYFSKQYLGLGGYQGCDFNGQIADATLCYLTYTVMSLEKRFTEYQTMGELFSDMEGDLMALTALPI